MNRLRLKEAEEFYKARNEGEEIKAKLEKELSPNSSIRQQKENRVKILKGVRKTYTLRELHIIAKLTGVSIDFLAGYEKQ